MKQWYYSKSNKQLGPVSEAELRQLLESNDVSFDAPVWTEGETQWKAASSFPSLTPSPYAPPAEVAIQGDIWSGYVPSGPQVRPWIRYWARTFDFLLFSLVGGMILGIACPPILEVSDTLLGVMLLLVYNLFEPIMFAAFGNTPMKALLRVRVRNRDGSRLDFLPALTRTLKVWLKGLGLGIPLISLFTHVSSYNSLTNHGITSWDAEGGFVVSHQEVPWWRWLIVILFIIGFIALMTLGEEAG